MDISQGYVTLLESYPFEHPEYVVRKSGRIKEHQYVMSCQLSRRLHKDERVHHRNGVRDDNRIENLELWSTSHPSGQSVADKVLWAKEILARYSDV